MKTVYILVGPPLAGKSTFRQKFLPQAFVICRDDILMELSTTDNYEEAFSTVDQKKVDEILKAKLEAGKNEETVVVDMTHMSPKRRKYHLSFFPEHKKIAVVFDFPSDEEFEKRNQKRLLEEKKNISQGVFRTMRDSYVAVQREEGFHKIISSTKFRL
jgi:predicted kinase